MLKNRLSFLKMKQKSAFKFRSCSSWRKILKTSWLLLLEQAKKQNFYNGVCYTIFGEKQWNKVNCEILLQKFELRELKLIADFHGNFFWRIISLK